MTGEETYDEPMPASNWTGWIAFAGTMLIIIAGFNIVEGLVALVDDSYYLTDAEGLAVSVPYAVLGWIQVAIGFVGVAIGIGLLRGNLVARIAGVLIAVISTLVHLTAIAAHPFWSVVVITFNVMVLYSILAHGEEMKTEIRGL